MAKQFCTKCNLNTDHMLLRRWTEKSGNPTTFIRAESWICCYCDITHEKKSEEPKPTEETMIVRRLLKLSSDYEQIHYSTLEVEGNMVTLRLKLFPWSVVQASKRIREAKKNGFYRLGDLWRLEQHGLLKSPSEDARPTFSSTLEARA